MRRRKEPYYTSILQTLYDVQRKTANGIVWEYKNIEDIQKKIDRQFRTALKQLEEEHLIQRDQSNENLVKINEDSIPKIRKMLKPLLLKGILDKCENRTNCERIDFLTNIMNNAQKDMELIETVRWKNLGFAILVFSASFGFILQTSYPLSVAIATIFIILLFHLYDSHLHKLNHAKRTAQNVIMKKISYALNNPSEDVEFFRYYKRGELVAKKERKTARRLVYIVLIIIVLAAGVLRTFMPEAFSLNLSAGI